MIVIALSNNNYFSSPIFYECEGGMILYIIKTKQEKNEICDQNWVEKNIS